MGKFEGMRVTGGLKIYPPLLRLGSGLIRGLMEIRQDRNYRVSYTPFGWVDEGGTIYIAGAPVWKGDKAPGTEGRYHAEKYGLTGLPHAVAMSKRHREHGTTVVFIDGRAKRMPMKAAAMMAEGKKKERVKFPSPVTPA